MALPPKRIRNASEWFCGTSTEKWQAGVFLVFLSNFVDLDLISSVL